MFKDQKSMLGLAWSPNIKELGERPEIWQGS
jgi:hypothetical protein